MAVRRNLKITSAIGAIDRRIKSLESTSNLSLPAGSVFPEADTDNTPGVGNRGEFPPDTFKKVIGARVYGPAATGNFGTRVELYFEETPEELEVIEFSDEEVDPEESLVQPVQVFGVNGYSNVVVNLASGRTFLPIEVARNEPTWEDYGLRESRNQTTWRETPPTSPTGKTVNSTIWYNPTTQNPDTTDKDGKDVPVTRAIDSASVNIATVTVTINAASHLYRVGDIIAVDLPAPYNGTDHYNNGTPDGLFEITAVGTKTITYMLDAPVAPATYEHVTGQTRFYIYGVARGFRPDGDVWIDESVEPNKVWVWKKLRWYDTADPIGDVTATQDGIAPSPVTNLEIDSEVPPGDTSPNILLTWTPPTTRSNGAPISGFFSGYEIWYKKSTDPTWKTEFVRDAAGIITTHTLNDDSIVQNRTYNIRVYVIDIMSQPSVPASGNILTATFSEVLNPPSKPTVTSRLGTITVTWDGNDATGNLPVPGVLYIEFHASNASGFTPSDATLVGTAPSIIDGNYIVLSDLTYAVNYYFKTVFVRRVSPFELDKSLPSAESDAIQVARLVNTDIIANTISGAAIQSGTITASDKIIGNTITGALIQALTIEAGNIKGNAIVADKLDAGAVTGVLVRGDTIATALSGNRVELTRFGIYAYDGNTPVFSFNVADATLTIGGYAKTEVTDSLSTSLNGKVSGTLNAGVWSTTITGDSVTSGTITGIVIRTANPAIQTQRIELQSSTMDIYDSAGLVGSVFGGTALGVRGVQISGSNVVIPNALTAGTVTASSGSFGSGSMGQELIVDKIRRQTNGQLNFTTGGGTSVMYIDTNATGATDTQIFVNGRVSAVSYTTRSSRRFKTNILPYSDPLGKVLNLNTVTYQMDPAAMLPTAEDELDPALGPIEVGLIAEEVADAGLGSIVAFSSQDGLTPEGIDYSRIGVLLIPVVKQLRDEINDLKNRLDNL